MEFCDKESLLLFSLSSSRCLWAIDLIVTTIICRQWFQLKWFLAMIWPWLLFDYYCPQIPKSRFAQCFQCFPGSSAICCKSVENPQDFENAAFYQAAPENSDRRHCSCQALSLCKKQDANSNAWVCVLLLPVPTVPPWHIVYLRGETVETSGLFALISFWVQLYGG